MSNLVDRVFSARLDCRYLLHRPEFVDECTPLVVALHGFGANPEVMFTLTSRLFGVEPVIASLQGPYQFFRDAQAKDVGYGWITSRYPADSIRLHHDMVSHVLDESGEEFGIPPERRILAGFSQPVSLNYRFAAKHPDAARGVIAICGGLPGDWDTGSYGEVRAAILHIARRQDEYYPPALTERYTERLKRRATDVEFHLLEGGHQIPSTGRRFVEPWCRRILPDLRRQDLP